MKDTFYLVVPYLKKGGFIVLLLLPAFVVFLAAEAHSIDPLIAFIQSHLVLYVTFLIALKVLSNVYPPLPGATFTLASIPIIGWEIAYLADVIGSMLGAIAGYFLGKKYGYTLLRKMLGEAVTQAAMKIKLKERNQVESTIFLRLASGGLLSDGLAWAASLIGLRFIPFMIGHFISHIMTTFPVFYLVSASISFHSWILFGLAGLAAVLIIYKFKGRYFE